MEARSRLSGLPGMHLLQERRSACGLVVQESRFAPGPRQLRSKSCSKKILHGRTPCHVRTTSEPRATVRNMRVQMTAAAACTASNRSHKKRTCRQ